MIQRALISILALLLAGGIPIFAGQAPPSDDTSSSDKVIPAEHLWGQSLKEHLWGQSLNAISIFLHNVTPNSDP